MSFTIKNSAGSPFVTGDFSIDNSSGTPFVVGNSVDNSVGTPFVITYTAILDLVEDTLTATDSALGLPGYSNIVLDAMILVDLATENTYRIRKVAETLNLNEALVGYADGKCLTEALLYQASIAHNGIQAAIIVEALILKATIKLAFENIVSENLTITAAAILDKEFLGVVRDICNFVDSPISTAKVLATMSVVFELMDTQGFSFAGALTETMSLIASEDDQIKYRASAIETMSLVGNTSASVGIIAVASDTASFTDSLDNMGLFQALIQDELEFRISFFDGRAEYSGWVVNAHNFAVTEYLNYEFNSFAKIRGTYFAAGPDGLYKLHSADNDGGVSIDAVLRTGKLNVGNGHQSRVEHAYLGVQSDGQLLLKTVTGDEKERWYRSNTPKAGLDNLRIKLGRGVKSAYWQFEVANIDGQDLEVENMQFFPVVLSRRV